MSRWISIVNCAPCANASRRRSTAARLVATLRRDAAPPHRVRSEQIRPIDHPERLGTSRGFGAIASARGERSEETPIVEAGADHLRMDDETYITGEISAYATRVLPFFCGSSMIRAPCQM